jgi:hypothetical protein
MISLLAFLNAVGVLLKNRLHSYRTVTYWAYGTLLLILGIMILIAVALYIPKFSSLKSAYIQSNKLILHYSYGSGSGLVVVVKGRLTQIYPSKRGDGIYHNKVVYNRIEYQILWMGCDDNTRKIFSNALKHNSVNISKNLLSFKVVITQIPRDVLNQLQVNNATILYYMSPNECPIVISILD